MIFTRLALQDIISEIHENADYLFYSDEGEEKRLKILISMAFSAMTKSDSLYFSAENLVSNAKIALEVCRALTINNGPPNKQFFTTNLFSAVLFANVGVIRGLLEGDKGDDYVIEPNKSKEIPAAHTDSILWRYRRERSILYLNENEFTNSALDLNIVSSAIRNSDFSVEVDHSYLSNIDKLVRSTFIIGFVSGTNFDRKLVQFCHSVEEGGALEDLGIHNVADFRNHFKEYFWSKLYIS